MDFSEYLLSKKIDETPFKEGDPDLYKEFIGLFSEMHPKSFTMQKLFLINGIRRRYPLPVDVAATTKKSPASRPKIPARKAASQASDSKQKDSDGRSKTSTGKPMLKPRPLKPKISGVSNKGDESAGTKKPARPVIKPKMPKPKADKGEASGNQEKAAKPKRPVMKPRIPAKSNEDISEKKAVRPKPLMKPRIPSKKKEPKDTGERDTSEENKGSKKKSKPIIKPRKKNE